MRRSRIDFPSDQTARTLATRFFCATRFWRICIALARILGGQGQSGSGLGQPEFFLTEFFLFDSDPPSALLIGTLLAAVICSTVFLISLSRGFLAASEHFELGCIEPAFFAAVHLSGMTGRKSTIAWLPQATAVKRSWLRDLRNLSAMIRIGFGQSGVPVP
jgi:hypothetical protein